MNIAKKVGSIGLSATLLASLFATAVAPSVLGASTVTSFGSVVQPFGTSTSTSAPFAVTFTEQKLTSFGNSSAGSLTLAVTDKNGANAANITLGGTLVVTAPGYAGVSASVAGNTLTITSTGPFDLTLLESITVSGITVKITSAVPTGALTANVTAATGDLAIAGWTSGATASGLLHTGVPQTTTVLLVDVSGSCGFVNATGGAAGDYFAGTTDLGTGAVTALAGGQQTITLTTGLAAPLAAGVTITQTNACAAALPFGLSSPGTVVAGVHVTTPGATAVQPGENNQQTGDVVLTEPAASAVIGVGTLTFTVAGGVFSAPPSVLYNGSGIAGGSLCSLSFDRTSCTVSITAASTVGGGVVTLDNIKVDVPSTSAQGAAVTIAVTGSPTFSTIGSPVTVANVARLVVSLAAQPTVFIGFNDQPSGMVSLTETQAGFFSADPTSPTNAFAICLDPIEPNVGGVDHFTRAPMAVVTVGDLKLAAGSPIAPAAQALGVLTSLNVFVPQIDDTVSLECAVWHVYTSSTAVSTIEIRGTDATGAVLPSGPTNGVRLSVDNDAQPGVVQAQIVTGFSSGPNGFTVINNGLLGIATRAFKNSPVVAAVPPLPVIPAGTARATLANLTITETQAGQFKPDEEICVDVVPLNTAEGYQYQTHFVTTGFTADQPVIATNTASGLLVTPLFDWNQNFFCFVVNQQATGTLGVITVSNMVVFTAADAAKGNILLDVSGGFGMIDGVGTKQVQFAGGQAFERTVAAGAIGTPGVADAWVAKGLGVRAASAFSLSTAAVKRGTYVTIRAKSSNAPSGALGQIWVKTKTTAWHLESSRDRKSVV